MKSAAFFLLVSLLAMALLPAHAYFPRFFRTFRPGGMSKKPIATPPKTAPAELSKGSATKHQEEDPSSVSEKPTASCPQTPPGERTKDAEEAEDNHDEEKLSPFGAMVRTRPCPLPHAALTRSRVFMFRRITCPHSPERFLE